VTGWALLFQYPLGRLSDSWDRRKMLGVVQVLGITTLAWMIWEPEMSGVS
jgi:MFS family permease